MRIRGAPLIAIMAVLGLSVDLTSDNLTLRNLAALDGDVPGARDYVRGKMAYLTTSHPTAVNLSNAMEELGGIVGGVPPLPSSPSSRGIVDAVVSHGRYMLKRDVSDNMAISAHGADDLLLRQDHPGGV